MGGENHGVRLRPLVGVAVAAKAAADFNAYAVQVALALVAVARVPRVHVERYELNRPVFVNGVVERHGNVVALGVYSVALLLCGNVAGGVVYCNRPDFPERRGGGCIRCRRENRG